MRNSLSIDWMRSIKILELSLRVPRDYVECVLGKRIFYKQWGTYKWYTYYGLALGPVELRWRPRS